MTRTTCPYCGVGCGLVGAVSGERELSIAADEAHPANEGRICSKGAALGDTVGLEGRLLAPMIDGRKASWERAIAHVANGLKRVIDRYGPDAVAFYVSGQLLTEDYYAANKLMKGFIGSGNIDTNSRLCMASAVAAHNKAFGADLVPGCYEDLDIADLVVLAGHNAAWTHPVLYRRMEAAKTRGQRHVVIDPRRTETADGADLFLPLAPQTDVRLWNGLLAHLVNVGAIDRPFIDAHVTGFDEVSRALGAADQSPRAVAQDCDLDEADVRAFYGLFALTTRTVTLFSMGANQSAHGVDKGLAIINAHLATGRIGKPGACPFSITGQPNAMGGRETGGMATTLAAHMGFDDASCDRVARFWAAPNVARKPGLKAVEMFDAVHEGRIKALWITATNPAVSLPNATRVREALARCPLVIVSDCMADTDTTAFAHVKLPALAWAEKDGTVTNSERCISRQRALFPPPGEARADWRIVADVATRMGFADAFSWRTNGDVFGEYARLTAYENEGRRLLDLSRLTALTKRGYDSLEPQQWGGRRLFGDGRFATPDGRARMHALMPRSAAETPTLRYPLSLNTGRVRDHWHTMTRTGLAAQLCRHVPEPCVDIHPADAEKTGIQDGALAIVETARGEAIVTARVTDRQRRGDVFMPMHWTDAFAPTGRVNSVTSGALDPHSGQPEFKHTPARAFPYRETWRGFFIARRPAQRPDDAIVWRRVPHAHAQLHEFAGRGDEVQRANVRRALLGSARGECLRLEDVAGGSQREAYVDGDRLECVLYFGARLPPRDWLIAAFAAPVDGEVRRWLLHGRAPGAWLDPGPLVCACAGVGERIIKGAIAAGACTTDAIGEVTRAGITCGACRPALRTMLASADDAAGAWAARS